MKHDRCPSCNEKHTKACIDGGRCTFCLTSLSSVSGKKTKKKKTWKTIKDSKVRHIWAFPDGSNEISIDPSFYADNGTPMCCGDKAEELGFQDEDMIYVRTEILM